MRVPSAVIPMANARRTEQDVLNEKSNRVMNGIALWCSFYRANPHRFCEDYLNIKLHFFQQILIVMMNINIYFMYFAARGQMARAVGNDCTGVGKTGEGFTADTEVSA